LVFSDGALNEICNLAVARATATDQMLRPNCIQIFVLHVF
jgi:hypothetical protein